MALLECRDLSLAYDNKIVLKNVNFVVNEGDYLCIVGENGSGKTTLMKALLGLQNIQSGQILVGGGLQRKQIGYLPQQSAIQKDFPASVNEIVLSGCQGRAGLRPFYSKDEKLLAKDTMQKMGINHIANRCYRELSGGQQQRVLLARALCATQKMLVLDEPVAGLDPKVTEEMYKLIYDLNRLDGITIIMISHDMSAALQYASHILHICDNSFFGSKEQYLNHSDGFNCKCYIGGAR